MPSLSRPEGIALADADLLDHGTLYAFIQAYPQHRAEILQMISWRYEDLVDSRLWQNTQ